MTFHADFFPYLMNECKRQRSHQPMNQVHALIATIESERESDNKCKRKKN